MRQLADLSPRRRALLWVAVLSGLLLAMLDQTIVGTALPRIVGDLGGESWYVWGITAYLVPATVLLPVFARLSDRYGRQRMLLTGMALFVLGSALCAFAQSMEQVAAFRAVQGAGAAALEALSFLLVAELSGPRRNATAQAVLAGIMAFSFIAGPMIGGLLTDHVGWRWVFLVNVPLGLLAIAVVARVLPAGLGRSQGRETPLDITGIAVLTVSLGLLLVGLNQHLLVASWFTVRTGGLVVAGLVGVGLFVLVERRAASAILPLRLLTEPLMMRLLLTGTTATFGLYACVMLLPRYYQQTQGVSATRSGVNIYPLLLGLLVAVNLGAAVIAHRNAFRGTLVVANGAVALGALGFTLFDASSPAALPLLLMALIGLGVGPNLSGLQIAVQRTVRPMDLGAAMGALLLVRQLGGALALAAAETIYAGRLHAGASAEAATGWSIVVVASAGAVIAALALLTLSRSAGQIRAPDTNLAVPALASPAGDPRGATTPTTS
jgi:EmrB/QacA subfamily drug resistance transporter